MTARFVPAVNEVRDLDEYFNGFRLRHMLQVSGFHAISWLSLTASRYYRQGKDGGLLRFSEHLDEQSITTLMKYGLKERYPDPVKVWEHRKNEFVRQVEDEMATRNKEFRKQMKDDSQRLLQVLESMVFDNIMSVFP
jgi:hypothetical protein